MKLINSYRFRIYPTPEQEETLFKTIGCARKTYNLTLDFYQKLYSSLKDDAISKEDYRRTKKRLNPSIFKSEHPYLAEVDSTALKYAKKNCDNAYGNFFDGRSQFPKFKKRSTSKWSYTTCRASKGAKNLRLERGGWLVLPKVSGNIKISVHRNPKGVLVSATVTRERSGRWFVSLRYEQHVPGPVKIATITNPVGLDMGIKDLAVTSDGETLPNLRHSYREKKRLSRIDRKLSRQRERAKKEGLCLSECANYQKTKQKRAQLYEKVKNRREDYLHKVTSSIVKNHDFVAVESLSSANLMKNHNLAYAISDASWNTFSIFLDYKSEKYGCIIQHIDRFYASTQLCSTCGEKTGPCGMDELNVREWTCHSCGTHHHRDKNAAVNILIQGLTEYLSATTTGTVGGEDVKHLLSLVNNNPLGLSSQEKFGSQELSVADDYRSSHLKALA